MVANQSANLPPVISPLKSNKEVIEDSNLEKSMSLVCVENSLDNLYACA